LLRSGRDHQVVILLSVARHDDLVEAVRNGSASGRNLEAPWLPRQRRFSALNRSWSPRKNAARFSERTKAALAETKARGVKLGGRPESVKNTELGRRRGAEARRTRAAARAKDLAPVIEAIRTEGITSAPGIAKALNERGSPTARGGKWQALQVQRLERARR